MLKKILLSAVVAMSAQAAQAADLTLTTEDYPPFNYAKDGKVTGIATDVVNKLFERAGVKGAPTLYPWQRAYAMAQEEPNTCVYTMARTEAREPLFKWVGPLISDDWVLWAKADSAIKAEKLDDLKGYTIGGYQGDAATDYFVQRQFKVEAIPNNRNNPKKLDGGRIDLWVMGKISGKFLASQEGVTAIKPVIEVKESPLYLGCGKSVPDDVIAKLNAELKAMHADGTVAAIQKNY